MTDESEKRFHSIMDKLFHAPKSPPNPSISSSSDIQTSRGKRRANPSSTLALVEPRLSSNVVASSLAPSTSSQAPVCRPWDRGDLMRRLATFKSMTWFAKPKVISALNCARRGWINVGIDTIACEACGARLLFSTPLAWNQQQVEKLAAVFSLKLDQGHKLLCPWIDNMCDEMLAQFPPTPPPVLADKFKERCSALLQLSFLPVISSSAIKHMNTPQLEKILEQSLVLHNENGSAELSRTEYLGEEHDEDSEKYYQAQKLISLCGWEPRLLPYVVDTGHASTQSLVKANVSSSLNEVANGKKNIGIDVQSTRIDEVPEVNDIYNTSDPNSVVLDCRLCGASVGLWAFSMVPRPTELFRLVGYAEINSEDHSGNYDLVTANNKNGTEVTSTGSDSATLSKERYKNSKLTIAGGPPPTKQNFKAFISLPVIGRTLRARFCNDAAFRDGLAFNKEKGYTGERGDASGEENDSRASLEGIEVIEPGILSGAGIHNHEMENLMNEMQGNFPDNILLESEGNDELNPSTVAPDGNTNRIDESGMNDLSLMVSSSNSDLMHISHTDIVHGEDISVADYVDLMHISHTDIVHGEDISLADYEQSSAVPSCLETNVDTEKTRNDVQIILVARFNNQEDGGGNDQIPVNNELVSRGTGKDQKQVSSEKAMEFDPIRQHRHFCPWIAQTGKGAPGWQQTLSALQRQQGSSPPSSMNSPSASIIKVDDPITSVRKLFTSPSPKRMKLDLVSARSTQN